MARREIGGDGGGREVKAVPQARADVHVEGARYAPTRPSPDATRARAANARRVEMARRANGGPVRYSLEEVRHQLDTIEGLKVLGVTNSRIIANVTRPPPLGLGISKHRAQSLIERVVARWHEDDQDRLFEKKAAAERRILGQIQNCQGRRAPRDPENPTAQPGWIEKPDHRAIARYEALLADIQGTRQPIQIEASVQYTEALVGVFAGYSLDDLKELHERAERNHKLAEAFRRENPQLAEAIEVEGTPAGE